MNPVSFRAIVPDMPPETFSWRLATGRGKCDEVWEGIYHVVEDKLPEQIDLENELENGLITEWAARTGGRVFRETRLAAGKYWEEDLREADYRVPSLCLYCSPESIAYEQQVLLQPPDVVIEVVDDPAYGMHKADYYRRLGVSEIWIVDTVTMVCDLICCQNGRWLSRDSSHEGPVFSPMTGLRIRTLIDGDEKRLKLEPRK